MYASARYFLLRESMLDSVLKARDKWMKPGGSMYPSHARMLLAPMRGNTGRKKQDDLQDSVEGWQVRGEGRIAPKHSSLLPMD